LYVRPNPTISQQNRCLLAGHDPRLTANLKFPTGPSPLPGAKFAGAPP